MSGEFEEMKDFIAYTAEEMEQMQQRQRGMDRARMSQQEAISSLTTEEQADLLAAFGPHADIAELVNPDLSFLKDVDQQRRLDKIQPEERAEFDKQKAHLVPDSVQRDLESYYKEIGAYVEAVPDRVLARYDGRRKAWLELYAPQSATGKAESGEWLYEYQMSLHCNVTRAELWRERDWILNQTGITEAGVDRNKSPQEFPTPLVTKDRERKHLVLTVLETMHISCIEACVLEEELH